MRASWSNTAAGNFARTRGEFRRAVDALRPARMKLASLALAIGKTDPNPAAGPLLHGETRSPARLGSPSPRENWRMPGAIKRRVDSLDLQLTSRSHPLAVAPSLHSRTPVSARYSQPRGSGPGPADQRRAPLCQPAQVFPAAPQVWLALNSWRFCRLRLWHLKHGLAISVEDPQHGLRIPWIQQDDPRLTIPPIEFYKVHPAGKHFRHDLLLTSFVPQHE